MKEFIENGGKTLDDELLLDWCHNPIPELLILAAVTTIKLVLWERNQLGKSNPSLTNENEKRDSEQRGGGEDKTSDTTEHSPVGSSKTRKKQSVSDLELNW